MEKGQVTVLPQYNLYPEIITVDMHNPTLRSPMSDYDLYFYETKETLMDVDLYKNFINYAVRQFRRCAEYKTYKSFLMSLGFGQCQVLGNITDEDADIELHHNILGIHDIALMITEHVLNTVGMICTMDLIQLLILEHNANRIPIVFLSETAHEMYTVDPNGYIPPEMTFGKFWELLQRYRFGITLEIAYKMINYIRKWSMDTGISIDIAQEEQILSFAAYNTYGEPKENLGTLPFKQNEGEDTYGYYY